MAAPTVGNQDFRGYLNYLSQQGDTGAGAALNYTGNDGGINENSLGSYYDSPTGTPNYGGPQSGRDYVSNAYATYNSLNSGGGGGTSVASPNTGAYSQAIGNTQSAIDRLSNQQSSGLSGIEATFQNALSQLLLGKNQGQQSYDTNKQQLATGNVANKNTIGSNAGSSLNGLLRLLGSRGAGGSSAATGFGAGTARGEVARGATLQRQDAENNFGQNNQGLDTGWNNYLTGYNNQVASANSQRDQQRQGLESSINSNRATLLQSLAQLQSQRDQAAGGTGVAAAQPYLDQANGLLDNLSNYQVAPINYQTQAYQAPSAASYTPKPQATPQYNGSGPSDYFSPYLASLLGKKQQTA